MKSTFLKIKLSCCHVHCETVKRRNIVLPNPNVQTVQWIQAIATLVISFIIVHGKHKENGFHRQKTMFECVQGTYQSLFKTKGWHRSLFKTKGGHKSLFKTKGWHKSLLKTRGWNKSLLKTEGWHKSLFKTRSWHKEFGCGFPLGSTKGS